MKEGYRKQFRYWHGGAESRLERSAELNKKSKKVGSLFVPPLGCWEN